MPNGTKTFLDNSVDGETDGPRQTPGYALLSEIGRGNYGTVRLARSDLARYCAVKIVSRNNFSCEIPFEREFLGVKSYEPYSREHVGLVKILHVVRDPDGKFFYYVMEIADDEKTGQEIDPDKYHPSTLASKLKVRGRRSVSECIDVGLALASAVAFLHSKGLVHRDIKPSNIILRDDKPRLADIGLVADAKNAHAGLGTPGYIPPEGHTGNPSADLYALGKVLYEMVTGNNTNVFPELSSDLSGVSDRDRTRFHALNRIIVKACDNSQDKRYKTARAMHDDLLAIDVPSKPRWQRALFVGACVVVATLASLVFSGSQWRNVPIVIQGRNIPLEDQWTNLCWHDLQWKGKEGWLSGWKETDGGWRRDIGKGVMLHTTDGGSSWQEINISNIVSGSGTNWHFNSETWQEVGPIQAIGIKSKSNTNGYMTTYTGIYTNPNPSSLASPWTRITPPPDDVHGYSRFVGMAQIEDFHEIYAVGWMGIDHWAYESGWQEQWSTFLDERRTNSYPIFGIYAQGTQDDREVWAVGRSAADDDGNKGIATHGEIYYLSGAGTNWVPMHLSKKLFNSGQALTAITQLPNRRSDVFAVGPEGLIVHGSFVRDSNAWTWDKLSAPTTEGLNYIAYYKNPRTKALTLWVVGNSGVVLKSYTQGKTWSRSFVNDRRGHRPDYLYQMTFSEDHAWIVGSKGVWKCELAP